ncbi:MAG: bifunctional nicotinamidase/pyrazinamidase [Promethearchaeota archaeon]|nr:MAG: bifunctional nicotinamidase/pyrazinamidase [Candidatus Lokiarchaeota archaeon]
MNINELKIEKEIKVKEKDALLVVDIQNDFLPGGALAVEQGDIIIEGVNKIAENFSKNNAAVIMTQDWHPKGHLSFASSYPDKNPGDEYQSNDGAIGPVLWPDHCVQGTNGAALHKDLNLLYASAIIRKGRNPTVDSYSAFLENDKIAETGLSGYLKSLKIKRIFICGLALDYCCYYSAMDAVDFGFEEVYLIIDLTKGIDLPPGNISNALEHMTTKGINFAKRDSFN